MIEMACPGCGRAGQVPKEKLHTRLVCRKCHVVFHVDPSGRPILGEPHSELTREKARRERDAGSILESVRSLRLPTLSDLTSARENLSDVSIPVKPVLGVLGGLAALWVVWGLLSGPGEAVADRARLVADALMRDDLAYIKTQATADTVDDAVRWYDAAHPKLEKARGSWSSKQGTISVVVVEEDHSGGKGETEVFFAPPTGVTQAASVVSGPSPSTGFLPPPPPPPNSSKGAAASNVPLSFHLFWIEEGGHWHLDGRQSFAMATR